jgi:hypothetical protein
MSGHLSMTEFSQRIGQAIAAIESQGELSDEMLLEMARLWNTLSYYRTLLSDPVMSRFSGIFRDQVLPRMVTAWKMRASRGMSLSSPEHDIEIGGILAEQYRYTIGDLHG